MRFPQFIAFRPLVVMTILAVAFNIGRAVMLHRPADLYLSWNMFLAILPLFVSTFIVWYIARPHVYKIVIVFAGLIWLALFPNAPYLLTDFIHLRAGGPLPIWYNIMMFFSAAWVGMLATFYSLNEIEILIRRVWSSTATWLALSGIMLLTSFGIYIGRFLRWNSWDVFMNPRELVVDIWLVFSDPGKHADAALFTGLFFIFIMIAYVAWRSDRKLV